MKSSLLSLSILLGVASALSAQVILTSAGFTPISVTGTGARDWTGGAANGVTATGVPAFGSAPAVDVTAALAGGLVPVTDWVILDGSDDLVHTRRAGSPVIGPITRLANTTNYSGYTEATPSFGPESNAPLLSWTGGADIASGTAVSGLNSMVGYSGSSSNTGAEGHGWTLSIPASTEVQYVRLWLGSYEAWGQLTASFANGDGTPLTIAWGIDNNNFGTNWVADIAFAASSPTMLNLTLLMDGGNPATADGDKGNFDGIWFSAVSTSAIPEPSTYALLGIVTALGLVILRRGVRRT